MTSIAGSRNFCFHFFHIAGMFIFMGWPGTVIGDQFVYIGAVMPHTCVLPEPENWTDYTMTYEASQGKIYHTGHNSFIVRCRAGARGNRAKIMEINGSNRISNVSCDLFLYLCPSDQCSYQAIRYNYDTNNTKTVEMACSNWTYDQTYFRSTVVSEVRHGEIILPGYFPMLIDRSVINSRCTHSSFM